MLAVGLAAWLGSYGLNAFAVALVFRQHRGLNHSDPSRKDLRRLTGDEQRSQPVFSIVSHASMAFAAVFACGFAALVGAVERSRHGCYLDKTVVGCPLLPA